MPKMSKETATEVQDVGIGTVRSGITGGHEFAFLTFHERGEIAPLLKGLPDDRCSCPHWGYVTAGSVTFTFADRTETYEAGDAFYVEPGHTPVIAPGSDLLFISPEEEAAAVNAVIQANMAAMAPS